MSDYGLRISIAGKDVLSDADEHMVFSTKFLNSLTLHTYGSGIIGVTGTPGTVTINHGLGYQPYYHVMTTATGDAFYYNATNPALYPASQFADYYIYSHVDTTNLYIIYQYVGIIPNYAFAYKYLIGRDRL